MGQPPSTHDEMTALVRRTVRGSNDGWRVKIAQQSGVDVALSSGGEAIVAAIGMGLGTRLTQLLSDYLLSPLSERRRTQSAQALPDDPRVVSASFFCHQCGERASTVKVIPAGIVDSGSGVLGGDFLQDKIRLKYDYWGEATLAIEEDRATEIQERLAQHDARALYEYSASLAKFYCPYCNRSYCKHHMRTREHLVHAVMVVPP